MEAAEIAGEVIEEVTQSVFEALGDQGNDAFKSLADAKKDGLISDKDIVRQLNGCVSGGRQGFNLYDLFVGTAHAAGGCTIELANGQTVTLTQEDQEACFQVYMIAIYNSGKSLGDKETARGFAEGLKA